MIAKKSQHTSGADNQRNNQDRRQNNQGNRERSPQRNGSQNWEQRRQRSNSGKSGSPVKLRGCIRCSSNNHVGDACTKFGFWGGPPCKYCGYLHDHKLCPKYNRDKKSDNKNRGADNRVNTDLTKYSKYDIVRQALYYIKRGAASNRTCISLAD